MATMSETVTTKAGSEWHDFHAEANLLSCELKLPIERTVIPQAALRLSGANGGYFFQRAEGYTLEGLISFKSGYTRVAGYRSLKNHGWVTLATSVLEGLNVFDVITADRVVAQVSTEHAVVDGHVPRVTFLGTQFENLKVSGYMLTPTLKLDVCGQKPAGDVPYLHDGPFLDGVQRQCDAIGDSDFVSEELKKVYGRVLEEIAELRQFRGSKNGDANERNLVCSLVSGVTLPQPIPGVKVVGNLVHIEDFGIVALGQLEVGRKLDPGRREDQENGDDMSNYFTLKMLEMRLGCLGHGYVTAGGGSTNGKTKP